MYRLTIQVWNATVSEWVRYNEDGELSYLRTVATSYGMTTESWRGLVRNGHDVTDNMRFYLSAI